MRRNLLQIERFCTSQVNPFVEVEPRVSQQEASLNVANDVEEYPLATASTGKKYLAQLWIHGRNSLKRKFSFSSNSGGSPNFTTAATATRWGVNPGPSHYTTSTGGRNTPSPQIGSRREAKASSGLITNRAFYLPLYERKIFFTHVTHLTQRKDEEWICGQ